MLLQYVTSQRGKNYRYKTVTDIERTNVMKIENRLATNVAHEKYKDALKKKILHVFEDFTNQLLNKDLQVIFYNLNLNK